MMTIRAGLGEETTKLRIDDARKKMLLGALAILALGDEQIAEFLLFLLLVFCHDLLGGSWYVNLDVSELWTVPNLASGSVIGVSDEATVLVTFIISIVISWTKDNILVVRPDLETPKAADGASFEWTIFFTIDDPGQQLFFQARYVLAVHAQDALQSANVINIV